MWKYEAVNNWGTISLHDCRITEITEIEKDIVFAFSDGYWIIETNTQNPYKKTLGTNSSSLTLTNAKCEKVEIDNKAITWSEFCLKVNVDKWEFECITESYSNNKCTYEGWIWFDNKPYHLDCCLEFSIDRVIYNWNEIMEDRPW